MSKHAIIVIKNNKNEYLQYYDLRWDSFLFLNCKLNESIYEKDIVNYISNILKVNNEDIELEYIDTKIHTKYSVSHKKYKEYEHLFYKVSIPINKSKKEYILDNVKFKWYKYEELLKDKRIQEVNSDIIGFIKDLNI